MLKNILLFLGLAFTFSAASAQMQSKTAEERAQDRTKVMTCELKLNEEEIPKVYAVNLHAAKRMDSSYTAFNNRKGPIKRFGKTVDKEREVLLRRVLTSDQFSLYLKIVEEDIDAMKQTEECRKGQKKN